MADKEADGAEADGLVALLAYVRTARRFDFSGYKQPSLTRRIQKRVEEVGCSSFSEYQDYLEVHPDEFESFFDTILINVTSFLRDPAAWEFLSDEIVPRIVSAKQGDDSIRVWSAGCASGEEAYSLAMVLCDALGSEQFRSRVKIYGTDADEQALTTARQATYASKELESLPKDYVERYFEHGDGDGPRVFRGDLRRAVIFGRHDLVQDAPISRLDLLVCRNTLMYFNAETQRRILDRFDFALSEGGYLFLGKAETLLRQLTRFAPVDLPLRVFSKVSDVGPARPAVAGREPPPERGGVSTLGDIAFDAVPVPMLVVDEHNTVVQVTAPARALFGVRPKDIGSPLHNLEVSYRPVELRSLLADAMGERRSVERTAVRWADHEDRRIFDVVATPLTRDDGSILGATIAFHEVTRYHHLKEELQQTNRDLEAAYEELQSTNEELETTNEELQSTIEELETTNEELQSSNEELETTNEELQSTNEELRTLNDQLDRRGGDLDRVNLHLQGILTGLRLAVVVVDRDLVVQLWNRGAEDLWGLRRDEVADRNLVNLDIRLPVEPLLGSIRRCLDGTSRYEEVTVTARNRLGQPIECRVVATPLAMTRQVEGVILMVEERPAAAEALERGAS